MKDWRKPDGLNKGKFRVRMKRGPEVIRPNKIAAGMSRTADRCGHKVQGDALTLVVYGTLARSSGMGYITERVACPCCGAKERGKRRLNDHGRLRLRNARRRAAAREAPP